ncbi:MAG: class I SAM-dependent methyltransferase [Bacteroidetes bacterium]|nr:class I SAM-dependent methyltransferase [Bacteroidota bacterium]
MALPVSKQISTVLKLFTEPKVLKALLSFRAMGYLYDTGWIRSLIAKMPVDVNGEAIPWVTLSFYEFMKTRMKKDFDVFEFGSGNSSLWFSKVVNTVTAIEHDEAWFKKMNLNLPKNVKIILSKDDSAIYPGELLKYDYKFDIITVDANHRNECLFVAPERLKEKGVIILDDSEREEYLPGINFLLGKGFRKIDFYGIASGFIHHKATTVFYKQGNCLDI